MNYQEKVLAAYLDETLPDFDTHQEDDTKVLLLLSETLQLERQVQDKDGQYRAVTIKEDSDGKITAHSIKLSNLLTVDIAQQISLLSAAMGILQISVLLKFTTGFLGVLASFLPLLKKEFNEQDAKVLLAIYKLHKKEFDVADIPKQLQSLDFEPLTPKKLNASLVKLANAQVLRSLGHGRYLVAEKLRFKRL